MKQGDKMTITVNYVSQASGKYWCKAGDTVTVITTIDNKAIVETKSKHRFSTLKTNLK